MVPSCVAILIPWLQENVVIDQSGRARLAGYGMGRINLDPKITPGATLGSMAPHLLAPELTDPELEGGCFPYIDFRGRALLTKYGLAPINSDPSFTVAATPGAVGSSRWLAPEIIIPSHKRNSMPVMESKTADVFAFGMFAVEVFTGKIPFNEHKNEAVVLRISQGGRPDMPENAQAVGLTGEIWKLLESVGNRILRNDPQWKRS